MWYFFFFELDFLLINYILLTEFSLCLFLFHSILKNRFYISIHCLVSSLFRYIWFWRCVCFELRVDLCVCHDVLLDRDCIHDCVVQCDINWRCTYAQWIWTTATSRSAQKRRYVYRYKKCEMESTVDFQFLFLPFLKPVSLSLSHCHVYLLFSKTTQNRIHVFF